MELREAKYLPKWHILISNYQSLDMNPDMPDSKS